MLLSNYILFCSQLEDVIKKYPNLNIITDSNGISFLKGIIDIPNDANEIVGNFLIEIHFSAKFPYRFPTLFEVGEIIPNEADWHKYGNGSCCITVTPDEILKCRNGISVLDFIENHVISYFANYLYRVLTGEYKNGEYAHGKDGIVQFYNSLLKTSNRNLWIQYYDNVFKNVKINCERNDKCLCGIDEKYKYCHLEVFNDLRKIGQEQVLLDFKLMSI